MSADSKNLRDTLVDQLSSFDSRLDDKANDVQMLTEIQDGIGRLLSDNGNSEAEIRRVLQERYESGELRKETFQLVKSMLDRYVTEQAPTSPGIADRSGRIEPSLDISPAPGAAPEAAPVTTDDPMSSTIVLPQDSADSSGSADTRVQPGSILRDRFMLQEQVSGGAMGVVYKALDRRLAEAGEESATVAIKILSPQLSQSGLALRALQQEAAKGRCLVHPNIVRFVDFDRDDELYFIVMEWLEGRTLADILDSPDSRSIDTERAFQIVRQVGKALDYAHRCGIVHADVKPGNIMIMPNGDAKLFDFGVARVRQQQLDKDPDFDPGVLGLMTPAYSSMQVLTGEKPAPSDDVFSLACLLYRLLAGYRVFGPRNAAEAAEEGMKPQRIDKLSDANWRVLKKALAYARVARFESMADFMDALDVEAAESITVDIPVPERFSEEASESRGSGRVIFGLIALVAVAGVAANQMGMLDSLKEQYFGVSKSAVLEEPEIATVESEQQAGDEALLDGPVAGAPAEEELQATEPVADEPLAGERVAEEATSEEPLAEPVVADATLEPEQPIAVPEPEIMAEPLVDFGTLPPPTAELRILDNGSEPQSVTVRLREDGRTASVDLVRTNTEFALTLRLEEVSFSGNRSPWASGQYQFSNNGFIEFPVGQDRARVELAMTPDYLREVDQQATLRIRETDTTTSELGTIEVILEDDDQRAFEATLPSNTIAFAASQITVNESDPAVQIDVQRFNPDSTPMVIGYRVRDITATRGEDYFEPSGFTLEFGPGQRVARILIPLVQDSEYEANEAFSVELSIGDSSADVDVHHRVAVLIRDDDQ
ncbi:MAG: protein kinase [Woeseiaceae bacterium]